MIKQIQLRGISRTPSDRLSEDGGLSESLNMYTDTAENAPVLIPEDVTERIGLPADLQAERIFVHKTANYENYVVVQSDRVVAYTPTIKDDIEPLIVLELTDGENITDITSIGNTLIFSSTKNLHYVLYRNGEYSFLGNKVPFPFISFAPKYDGTADIRGDFAPGFGNGYPDIDIEFLENEWNEKDSTGGHSSERVVNQIESFWEDYDKVAQEAKNNRDLFSSPIFVRYAAEMYDDSLISSMPILINPKDADLIVQASYDESAHEGQFGELERHVQSRINTKVSLYKIFCQIMNAEELDNWRDLYRSINLYITRPFKDFVSRKATTILNISEHDSGIDPSGEFHYSIEASIRMTSLSEGGLLIGSKDAYEVKKIEIFDEKGGMTQAFEELKKGFEIAPSIIPEGGYETQKILINDDMKHYLQMSPKLDNFNNRLVLVQPSQIIDYDYERLNSYDVVEYEDNGEHTVIFNYEVTYLLHSDTDDKVVKKQFASEYRADSSEDYYAFQIFPDARAYKMIVRVTYGEEGDPIPAVRYGEFDMHPHPYLDCAYFYSAEGINKRLWTICNSEKIKDYPINAIDDLENKLVMSEINDPFVFPIKNRYTFQSNVVGVAVASTALSQGQFGQFPLYVFTEDGIWAMETAADGSFVTSKPLSREVCINPDSITSIDNAVVFVTSKGVMMIQGSQVMNISAYMNGRHYVPNESAKNLISKQSGYSEYESAISDVTPFTEFMRDAKVAYDYNGQRLIFISPENRGFQYVYKIDTQTWHKMAFEGFDLQSPINAYPECLIQGSYYDEMVRQSARVLGLTEEDLQVSLRLNDGNVYVRTDNLDEIDRINDALYAVDKDWTYLTSEDAYEYTIAITGLKDKAVPRWVQDILGLSDFKFQRLLNGKAFGNYTLLASKEEDDDGSLITDDKYGLAAFFKLTIVKKELCYKIGFTNISIDRGSSRVYSLSTRLDISAVEDTDVAKGILITRPFDLGMPDVFKSITEIKIRGYYDKGNIKYILQGSDNGKDFYTMNSLRGKSWKMFRLFILADLEPTERVSWIDIDFEPRYNNRLR